MNLLNIGGLMSIEELKKKKEYLSELGAYTKSQLETIKCNFILNNTHSRRESKYALSDDEKLFMIKNDLEFPENIYSSYYCDELIGIYYSYHDIIHTINEESNFPYPPNYRHPFTEETLKDFNRFILNSYLMFAPFEKGHYREGTNKDKLKKRTLPTREIFLSRLIDLMDWYVKTDCDLLTKLAIFYLKFESDIHPFYDGNGRTGRMVMNLELAREGYPMIGLKYDDVEAYEKAFELYDKSSDYKFMKSLIYNNINKQLDKNILIKKK